jgi:hypothetical protein
MSSPTVSNGSASTISSTAQSQYQDRLISKSHPTPKILARRSPKLTTHPSLLPPSQPTHTAISDRRGSFLPLLLLFPVDIDFEYACANCNCSGGRTAWSCTVTVGSQTVHARFWYDGQYVNNAREDAAERALQCFGQLPTPAGPQPAHLQQLQQRHYGAVSS